MAYPVVIRSDLNLIYLEQSYETFTEKSNYN